MAEPLGMDRLLADLGERAEFPAAAAVAARLRDVIGNDRSSAVDVAAVILKDPGLSSTVLRIVQSAFYQDQGSSLSTITQSVCLLGFDAIRDLATSIALLDQIAKAAGAHPPVQRGLTRSLLSGLMARALAGRVRYDTPEEAYLLGLFANWGVLWLTAFYPHEFERAQRLAVQQRAPLDAALREVFGVLPAELAGRILSAWSLPTCYSKYFQAEVPHGRVRRKSSTAMLFGVVHVADAYAAAHLQGEGPEPVAPIARRFATMFDLAADAFHAAADQATDELADHVALFGLKAVVLDGGEARKTRTRPPQ